MKTKRSDAYVTRNEAYRKDNETCSQASRPKPAKGMIIKQAEGKIRYVEVQCAYGVWHLVSHSIQS